MTETDNKEIKVREKQELSSQAEPTRPGLVFTPRVDIYESEKDITVLADMPGVKSQDLSIDLRDNTLTLVGDVVPDTTEKEELLLSEYATGRYYRQFSLSEVVDQNRIEAQLKDGVLRLSLPKVERATPRKIAVKAE